MNRPGRVVLGLALVAAGVVLLLDAQGMLDAGETLSDWWPLLLVVLGVLHWITDRRAVVSSLVLIVIGTVLLGIRLELLGDDAWWLVWPVALIGAGAWILIGRSQSTQAPEAGSISVVAILSGRKVAAGPGEFRRGHATVVLGAADIDLTNAIPGPGAAVTATVVIGGCDIIVPPGWRVRITGTPIIGGWDDTTQRDVIGADAPELEVRVLTVLGGVEVRHPERWGR